MEPGAKGLEMTITPAMHCGENYKSGNLRAPIQGMKRYGYGD